MEELKNSGKERVINLIASRIKNLEKTLKNTLATAVYADGTTDTKSLGGLQQLVIDDPTASASVGGINQSTYSFWQNQTSGDATLASSANMDTELNEMYLKCIRGTDKPDFIVSDSVLYNFFESGLQQFQRFSDASVADMGFESLKYKMADFFYDDQCPASHCYMLNSDYLFLRPHTDRQFKPLVERQSINQDACVEKLRLH